MMVCLWRYKNNTRNYPGYHLSADLEGCRFLRENLSTIGNRLTIPLNKPDKAVLSVPNNQGGRARFISGGKLRVEIIANLSDDHFEFDEREETIVLTCSRSQIGCLLRGIEDIESGEGDYCIRGDGAHALWFWWQTGDGKIG